MMLPAEGRFGLSHVSLTGKILQWRFWSTGMSPLDEWTDVETTLSFMRQREFD
jgi:hypothetical protein